MKTEGFRRFILVLRFIIRLAGEDVRLIEKFNIKSRHLTNKDGGFLFLEIV